MKNIEKHIQKLAEEYDDPSILEEKTDLLVDLSQLEDDLGFSLGEDF